MSSDEVTSASERGAVCSRSWSDDDLTEHLKAKRYKCSDMPDEEKDNFDNREWTEKHLEAAGRLPKPSIAVLTPPQTEHLDMHDIDVRGPGGYTPLMIASFCGSKAHRSPPDSDSTGSTDIDTEEGSAAIITELINQGAAINAKTDRTGETSLHLAARYSRSDAAKRLLEAGSDPNAQDSTGRTPLHAAVAADAIGVFQILLRHRATKVNAQMHDGTTPLMLAVRLAVEGIVTELIGADADVNATDMNGKTALHWAAAVNNVDALVILLRRDAHKDAQDAQDQTPLFLAAREGSYEAVKILLEHNANRDIADHMDRQPRQVAHERMHHDIVNLLDDYVPTGAQRYQSDDRILLPACSSVNGSAKGKLKKAAKKVNNTPCRNSQQQLQQPVDICDSSAVDFGAVSTSLLPSKQQTTAFVHPHAVRHGRTKMSVVEGYAAASEQAATTMPLLDVHDLVSTKGRTFEMPPSYETACGAVTSGKAAAASSSAHLLLQHDGSNIATISGSMGSLSDATITLSDAAAGGAGMQPKTFHCMPKEHIYQNAPSQQLLPSTGSGYNPDFRNTTLDSSEWLDTPTTMGQRCGIDDGSYSTNTSLACGTRQMYAGGNGAGFTRCGNLPSHSLIPKKGLALSPTHIQAMQQQRTIVQGGQHFQQFGQHDSQSVADSVLLCAPAGSACQMWQQQQLSLMTHHHQQQQQQHRLHHYPTPPSQHSYDPLNRHLPPGFQPEQFLTPSPDSPGQWSSSSPHSGQSDWSEGVSSPPQASYPIGPTNSRMVPRKDGGFLVRS
jgi:Notch-like protein